MDFGWRHSSFNKLYFFIYFFLGFDWTSWLWSYASSQNLCLRWMKKRVRLMLHLHQKISISLSGHQNFLSFVWLITIISDFNYLKLNGSNRLVNLFLLPSTFFWEPPVAAQQKMVAAAAALTMGIGLMMLDAVLAWCRGKMQVGKICNIVLGIPQVQ